jgi:hypothetical protein
MDEGSTEIHKEIGRASVYQRPGTIENAVLRRLSHPECRRLKAT